MIHLCMRYQQLQWFISPSMHSALEINNSEKKGMGLKLRKEPPVFWWQFPKQHGAASHLRSNASFQTCSHSLLVELFGHFSGMQHFYKEVKKRKQHNFFLKCRKTPNKKVFEWSLNFCTTLQKLLGDMIWDHSTALWQGSLEVMPVSPHHICSLLTAILWWLAQEMLEVPGFLKKGLLYPGRIHHWLPGWRQQHRKGSRGLQGW